MSNETKKCFSCNSEIPKETKVCPKCGFIFQEKINPEDYNRELKSKKWSAGIGLTVGFLSTIAFGGIKPNSYLFLIGIALGLLSAWITFICFDDYYKSQGNCKNQDKEVKSDRELRWERQKELDKTVLDRNDFLANQMLNAITVINAMWDTDTHLYKDDENVQFRVECYISAITAALFVNNYNLFKKGNSDEIKDSIYQDMPYLLHDTIISMGLYIFKTNNQAYALKIIIKDEKGEINQEIKNKAKLLLQSETSNKSYI